MLKVNEEVETIKKSAASSELGIHQKNLSHYPNDIKNEIVQKLTQDNYQVSCLGDVLVCHAA